MLERIYLIYMYYYILYSSTSCIGTN